MSHEYFEARINGGFEIRQINESKGVGMFATRRFLPEDLILEESPLVAAQFLWNETCGYIACHHCMKPLETIQENVRRLSGDRSIQVPLPQLCPTKKEDHLSCKDCGVKFCSLLCYKYALDQYHKTLCFGKAPSLVNVCSAWKEMHYPPETTSIMLVAKIIAMIEQSEEREELKEKLDKFVHSPVDAETGLVLNMRISKAQLEVLLSLMQKSIPIKHAASLLTVEGFEKLFTLIARNGQGIGTSVLSEWVNKVDKFQMPSDQRQEIDDFVDNLYKLMDKHTGTEFLNTEASGLYEYQKCINHSCAPNAYISLPYSTSRLKVIASKVIEPDEEIFISYLDECTLERSRHSRNKELKEYYLFECDCERCLDQAGDPDVTSDEEEEEDGEGENDENERRENGVDEEMET